MAVEQNILFVALSPRRVVAVILLESIYGCSGVAVAWLCKGSIWFAFGTGFLSGGSLYTRGKLYKELVLGIMAVVPLLFSIVIVNRFTLKERVLKITRTSVLYIFGKDFRPLTVGCCALCLAVVAGVGEEMFFRAMLQEELSVRISEPAGFFLSALLFGMMHAISFEYAFLAALAGMYFSWLYIVCGRSILVGAISHTLYDWFVFMRFHYEVTHCEVH